MAAVLLRVALVSIGFAVTELSLGGVFASGSIGAWAALTLGVLLVVAGTASFMGPLLASGRDRTTRGVSR